VGRVPQGHSHRLVAENALDVYNNDNVYRVEMENKDSTGTVDSTNPWFTMTTDYDANNFRPTTG